MKPVAGLPPETWERALRLRRTLERPLERFLAIQAAGGIVLVVSAVVAVVWANSPYAPLYRELLDTRVGLVLGPIDVRESLHFVINEVLMTIFFFVVGLEIRREIHHGELSRWRSAVLPLAAALGGMVAPALIYAALNRHPATHHGWGIPMATDIAFAVGILAILGDRVPAALRVLLLALAIIDDVGSIIVIAAFYSGAPDLSGLFLVAAGMGTVFLLQRLAVRRPSIYVIPGVMVWLGLHAAHVHPTLAGVLVGLATPARPWLGAEGFTSVTREVAEEAKSLTGTDPSVEAKILPLLAQVRLAREEAVAPATRIVAALNPWVAYIIMPLFALANAGVPFRGFPPADPHAIRVAAGVVLGLVVGKPIGIVLASALAVRIGIATLPRKVDLRGLVVVGTVAGIGFTMAIFIASLAFSADQAALLDTAKAGILLASITAAILGLSLGGLLLSRPAEGPHPTADECEASDHE